MMVNEITLVSSNAAGNEGNNHSYSLTPGNPLSADDRFVIFRSVATNLVGADANGGLSDIFVKDLTTGAITLVSSSSEGLQGNGASFGASLSADGGFITFASDASNLVAGDANGATDIFVKNGATGATSLVSSSSAGVGGNGASDQAGLSTDGRFVAFRSAASDLVSSDENGVTDIFVKNLATGELTLVSSSLAGDEGNGQSYDPNVSGDGGVVSFASSANNLVSGDANGTTDIFVKDLATGETTLVSSSSTGLQGNNVSDQASLSADGQFVVFRSAARNLVSGDTNGVTDIFVKNLATGELTLVSSSSAGVKGNGASSGASLSADGRFVAFVSASSNLVANDTNGAADVFVKDLQTGEIRLVTQDTAGGGANAGSEWARLSADGEVVTFYSDASDLVNGDTNNRTDVFVAPTGFEVNEAPTAAVSASPNPVAPGETVALDAGASSDPDGDTLIYAWDLDNDGEFDDAIGVTATVSFQTFGSRSVGLQVSDGGLVDTETVIINVDQGNQAPTADGGGPYLIAEGDGLTLDASSSSDPNTSQGDSLVYVWDLDNDGEFDDATGVSPTIDAASLESLGLSADTPHTVRVRVTDSFGETSTDASTLVIDAASPTLAITASDAAGDADGEFTLGETLTLSFAFSEEQEGFEADDVVLSGGTLLAGSFAQDATDPTRYTVQATFSRPGSVTVAGGAYADLVGHAGTGDSLTVPVVGTPGADRMEGTDGPDTLEGRDGNDTLIGGANDDSLIGGAGNDTYFVDSLGDRVVEAAGADQGTADAVRASVDYVLGTDVRVEILSTAHTAGTDGIDLTGNDFANGVTGNSGANVLQGLGGADILRGLAGQDDLQGGADNDTLIGGAGADTMAGGDGSDIYVVDDGLDQVTEASGQGYDRVRASVDFALSVDQEIERLETANAAGLDAIDLTGNNLAQAVLGNRGDNVLNGGSGGQDRLTGRAGLDTFVFDSELGSGNSDRIIDFSHADDVMHLDVAVFATLDVGALADAAFKDLSTGRVDADDRILYNPTSGVLLYDVDGRGGVAAVAFANLLNRPADLAAADFLVTDSTLVI